MVDFTMNIGQKVLKMLQDEITEIEYNRYIKQLHYSEELSKSNFAYFIAPNALIANFIKTKYTKKIEHLFEVANGQRTLVKIALKSSDSQEMPNQSAKNTQANSQKNPQQHSLLNPSHSFENFVVGGSNQFAYSACKAVSEKPGILYNPVFIYGGVGLGKTHLMQAVGIHLQQIGKSVIYTSVEQFLNDFIRHLNNKTMELFREKYRKCDVLLIDDIQFLSNKQMIQEEFFNTFETLKGEDKQIIMTADKHPKQIKGIEDRLISRFEWGLVVDIQPPELETKIAIIRKKCQINRVHLDNTVVNYIATVIDTNVREIEGILSKLHAYSKLMHVDIDIEFTKNVLKDQIREKRENVSVEDIINEVAKDLNIKPSDIKSKGRSKNIVYARRIAIYLSRELTNDSMPKIAQNFGMKDHTAVSHTMKKINELIKNDSDFKIKIDELLNKITTSEKS